MKLVIDLQGAQTESQFRGIGRQARMLARAMIAHAGAHDVSIVLNRGLDKNAELVRQEFRQLVPLGNIRFFDIPGDVAECHDANIWRMRAAELMREAFLAGLKPDVVHVTSLFEGMNDNAVTSIGLMRAPYATSATLFDLIPLYDPAKYLGASVAQRFYYRRAQSLKRADLLLAISESARREATEMLSIPAGQIEVTLLAADASFVPIKSGHAEQVALRAKYRLPGPFVLYVGAIEARKNVALIVEAFSRLPSALQQTYWMVFGGRLHPPERLQLRAAASRFGVDTDRLIFPGFIDENDLPALYGLCDLFVFPSMHEGFGLPPLEAMACGAPVLSARNSSLPEVMGRDDLLFGTFDPDDLASKMRRILTDAEYSASIRAWGIEQAARFSWEGAGQRAIQALERLHDRHRPRHTIIFGRRPRLAFFSPLPSDRSGIADYSVELLKELGRTYDIECIVHETFLTDPWLIANFTFRDVSFFKRHADSYDRIVYSIGNSAFHTHMFELLESHPGVVILHDFYLSGVHAWLGNTDRRPKADFLRELYLTHGLSALRCAHEDGREVAATRFAANRLAFEESLGVIVHSRWAVEQAKALFGPTVADKVIELPMLRGAPAPRSKSEARRRLGIGTSEFLVCSFGFVADTKLSQLVYEAWAASKTSCTPGASLAFVGDNTTAPYGVALLAAIEAQSGDVAAGITGYVDAARYNDYLAAADLAVQLRTNSRGETSRAVLDCIAAQLPVIVNAHGTTAEISPEAVVMLPDRVTAPQLTAAIDDLFQDPGKRCRVAENGLRYLREYHNPHIVGNAVATAIEAFSIRSEAAQQGQLLTSVREVYANVFPSEHDLQLVSGIIARQPARVGLRRILFDVTLLAESDGHTGIERVVRSILSQLIDHPPPGYRLEPVRIESGGLRFARRFVAQKLLIPADILPDAQVDYDAGDIYLALEWAAERLPDLTSWLQHFRQDGGRVVIGINDLLPLMMPHRFPPHIGSIAERWFETVLLVADQLVCISRTVADDVLRFGNALSEGRNEPIAVDWYHCASDIRASLPTKGVPANASALLDGLKRRSTFLMVGTVEPRKGHMQVLKGFVQLWAQGMDVGLVIIGRKGWMVEAVERLVQASPQLNKRLLWLSQVSDEYLERVYDSCTALLAASEGEGFGLPLVEAASRGLPILARDLPVFREVAGSHATYFSGLEPEDLARAVTSWIAEARGGRAPDSKNIATLSWEGAAKQLTTIMLGQSHYGRIGA